MIKLCQNGRQLIIKNTHFLDNELQSNWTPFSILLSTSFTEKITELELKILIKFLAFRGSKTFVCIGYGSEILHDNIDTILCELEEESNLYNEIITTYHPDEPISDVVNYFIFGTETVKNQSGGLLALLSSDNIDVIACIEAFCSKLE